MTPERRRTQPSSPSHASFSSVSTQCSETGNPSGSDHRCPRNPARQPRPRVSGLPSLTIRTAAQILRPILKPQPLPPEPAAPTHARSAPHRLPHALQPSAAPDLCKRAPRHVPHASPSSGSGASHSDRPRRCLTDSSDARAPAPNRRPLGARPGHRDGPPPTCASRPLRKPAASQPARSVRHARQDHGSNGLSVSSRERPDTRSRRSVRLSRPTTEPRLRQPASLIPSSPRMAPNGPVSTPPHALRVRSGKQRTPTERLHAGRPPRLERRASQARAFPIPFQQIRPAFATQNLSGGFITGHAVELRATPNRTGAPMTLFASCPQAGIASSETQRAARAPLDAPSRLATTSPNYDAHHHRAAPKLIADAQSAPREAWF